MDTARELASAYVATVVALLESKDLATDATRLVMNTPLLRFGFALLAFLVVVPTVASTLRFALGLAKILWQLVVLAAEQPMAVGGMLAVAVYYA